MENAAQIIGLEIVAKALYFHVAEGWLGTCDDKLRNHEVEEIEPIRKLILATVDEYLDNTLREPCNEDDHDVAIDFIKKEKLGKEVNPNKWKHTHKGATQINSNIFAFFADYGNVKSDHQEQN